MRSGGESAGTPTWIVDPLDGTANFACGLDHVAVAVGLAIGGTVQLGVVHAPFLGETFWAVRGQGAWRNVKLETEPALARAAIATGFPHQRTGLSVLLNLLERLLDACGSVRGLGAPVLDLLGRRRAVDRIP